MHNLVVNNKLTTAISENKHTDAAATIVKSLLDATEEAALVEHRQALLDIACLSHGHKAAVFTDIKDTELLENRAQHILHNYRGSRVGDEAALLMEGLSEEIDAEVAMLAGLR